MPCSDSFTPLTMHPLSCVTLCCVLSGMMPSSISCTYSSGCCAFSKHGCLLCRLSATQESEFPLATVSLNITNWTLQKVRERKLSSAAKKQQSAVTAASDFYTGTFYAFYNHWRDKKCTMADSGFVLQEIEKRSTKNVMTMVKRAGTKL